MKFEFGTPKIRISGTTVYRTVRYCPLFSNTYRRPEKQGVIDLILALGKSSKLVALYQMMMMMFIGVTQLMERVPNRRTYVQLQAAD